MNTTYMQTFFHTKEEAQKLTKEDGILSKKFHLLSVINRKIICLEHTYSFGNKYITKLEYEFQFNSQELAKVNEKLEKLVLLSFDEKKQLYYEQLVLKFKVERCAFELKYGKNSTHNLIQKY